MTTFTAEDLLYVANTTKPRLHNGLEWAIDGNRIRARFIDTGEFALNIYYDPEENSDQWRALAEYCIKHWQVPKLMSDFCHGTIFSPFNITGYEAYNGASAFNRTDCMIAAVLALREGEDV